MIKIILYLFNFIVNKLVHSSHNIIIKYLTQSIKTITYVNNIRLIKIMTFVFINLTKFANL